MKNNKKKNISFWIFGLIVFIFLIEVLSYFFLQTYKKSNEVYFNDIELSFKNLNQNLKDVEKFFYSKNYSANLGWDNNSSKKLNNIKARIDTKNQSKDKKYITFGSSFTWGDGVGNEETWQYYLSSETNSYVANFGVGGYSIYQSLLKFKDFGKTSKNFEYVILTIFESEIDRIRNGYLNFYFKSGYRIRPLTKKENNNLTHLDLPKFSNSKFSIEEYKKYINNIKDQDPWWTRRVKIKFPFIFSLTKFVSLKLQDKYEFKLFFKDHKNTWTNPKTNKLFLDIIDEFVSHSKNLNLKPVVVFLPRIRNKLASGYKFNLLEKKLIDKNYCIINFSKYINKNKVQNNKLTVLEDGHYSGYTYKVLAKFIFDELQNC